VHVKTKQFADGSAVAVGDAGLCLPASTGLVGAFAFSHFAARRPGCNKRPATAATETPPTANLPRLRIVHAAFLMTLPARSWLYDVSPIAGYMVHPSGLNHRVRQSGGVLYGLEPRSVCVAHTRTRHTNPPAPLPLRPQSIPSVPPEDDDSKSRSVVVCPGGFPWSPPAPVLCGGLDQPPLGPQKIRAVKKGRKLTRPSVVCCRGAAAG
jgi:hypothetical protein